MDQRLQDIKKRQKLRRQLLAQQLGVSSPESLGSILCSKDEQRQIRELRSAYASPLEESSGSGSSASKRKRDDVTGQPSQSATAAKASVELSSLEAIDVGSNPEDENEGMYKQQDYKDSSTFLKGTQSLNPHNDYCQHFVDTGQRPQNFIRDVGLADRFEEYPKLRELIRLKDDLIARTNCPPMYLQADLPSFPLASLQSKFDVLLVEPPLCEYYRGGALGGQGLSWSEVMQLDIEEVAAQRSFIFLWCGSSDGLDYGRQCLCKWGFRRCEDICWIKTNKRNPGSTHNIDSKAVFQRTKEHCLMGIRGTVRRSTDGDFIHANVDIDLMMEEEEEEEPAGGVPVGVVRGGPAGVASAGRGGAQVWDKPREIFHIVEHFCLGRRRLHLFGRDSTIRPGWLTVGPSLTNSNFSAELYNAAFSTRDLAHLTGCSDEIERLRPKSPPPKNKGAGGGGVGSAGASGSGAFRGRGGFMNR